MNNQETNQTAPATDTKPVVSTAPDNVKLELTADEAKMVQDLLSNFVYAYRSDREVDYKRELVPKDKIGKYPYVAEAPDPSIVNPIYDWVGKKWYSKTGATSLPEIAQAVKTLQTDQQVGTAQDLALTKSIKELSDNQVNQNKLLASMQHLMLQIANQKQDAPAQPSTTDKQENGGN